VRQLGSDSVIDNMALLAIGAFGWGLSLCTYRIFARRNGWPMGSLHADLPAVPTVIGLVALFIALTFAAARGAGDGWVIVLFGALLAVFWTGFLRVGSQVSLVLAPLATVLLVLAWLSEPYYAGRFSGADVERSSQTARADSAGGAVFLDDN